MRWQIFRWQPANNGHANRFACLHCARFTWLVYLVRCQFVLLSFIKFLIVLLPFLWKYKCMPFYTQTHTANIYHSGIEFYGKIDLLLQNSHQTNLVSLITERKKECIKLRTIKIVRSELGLWIEYDGHPFSLLASFLMAFNWISPGLHRNFIESIEQFPHQSVKIDVYLIRLIVMVKCILCTKEVQKIHLPKKGIRLKM